MSIHSIENYGQSRRPYSIPTKPATNFRTFSPLTTDYFVKEGEKSFPALSKNLKNGQNVVQTLYILDRIQENKTGDTSKLYPELSRYNKTKNAEIQTFLAGIYRKTQVPDAFGPLVAMLIQNALNPPKSYFDPNEEIGGAIVSYFH
ncbi:MAG: hypothetical protein NC390_06670 [Fusobacterium sp.]|nr:hypothetical protein [Fusobacterium sp.]